VKKVTAARFAGTPVVPGMVSGTTDSRHLRNIGIRSYGVSPSFFTRAEAKAGHAAHGPDERKPVKWVEPGAEYFREVVRALAM
jgi:carboxypeptidase PM20D1